MSHKHHSENKSKHKARERSPQQEKLQNLGESQDRTRHQENNKHH